MCLKYRYRIRNWSEYNRALIQRGSISVWFTEDAISKWLEQEHPRKKGRRKTFSDDAILCVLILRAVYHLPLRALQGFLEWLFQTMGLALPVPSYTQICRRAASLEKKLKRLTSKQPTDIVFDSTGVKVYGEGEWKVRQHGKGKRRTWRKIHLAVCPHSHEIVLGELTKSSAADGKVAKEMVKDLPKRTKKAYGDGAYDQGPFYETLYDAGIAPNIPPRRGGRIHDVEKKPWIRARNDAIREIVGLGGGDEGRKLWKILTGYHTRSLGETCMYRFKQAFSGTFRSRDISRQKSELYAKCIALNKMTKLGMPKGRWVKA
jgi:hypothetical protein